MSFGSGAMTNSIDEIADTPLLFVIGANPTEAHPVIGAKMKQALRKGATLIVADPRKTELAQKAQVHLQLRPGSDIALINGIIHIIIQENWQDSKFIQNFTEDFEEVRRITAQYTPSVVSQITGVSRADLYQAAKLYAKAPSAGIYYTLGITEHVFGTHNVLSLSNLAMLTGNVGKPYSGVNPLRGQNNVQGACDMGCLPNYYPGYQRVTDPFVRQKFEKAWKRTLSPEEGYSLPQMLNGMLIKALRAFYVMGENPAVTDANLNHVTTCLKSLDLLIVQDLFLTQTAKLAHVVFPAASFAEKDGTFTNTERRVQRVRPGLKPLNGSMTDGDIIMALAKRMGFDLQYDSMAQVMDEMASLSPIYGGVSFDRIEEIGLQWPVLDQTHPGTAYLHKNGQFSRGKGRFYPIEYQPPAEQANKDYPYILMTGRILYHYNVTTYGYSANLTEVAYEEAVRMHPNDAKQEGLRDGQWVTVSSKRGTISVKVKVTEEVLPGHVWMSFHYADCLTNMVTNDAHDRIAKTYEYKVCAVKILPKGRS